VTAEARKQAAEQQKRVEEIVEDYRKLFSNNNKRYFTGL
jgi:hypothetical protein